MSHADLTGGLKTNREERLTKHVGFVYANAQKAKNKKINDEKCGESTIKNKTYFSLFVFDCDFEDALLILISLN